MKIQPIQKVNVGEQVFQQMKKQLITGEWKPGDKLPSENELADMFNVSRITIRQALQKLSALDLVETRLGEGSFVKEIEVERSLNELIPTMYLGGQSQSQVIEFREIIDSESARLAAKRAEKGDIEELRALVGEMKKAQKNKDSKVYAKSDLAFHVKIGEMTRNPLIIKTNSILLDILEESMDDVIRKMGFEPGIYYHEKILDAIENGEASLAMKLMREHISKNESYFEEENK